MMDFRDRRIEDILCDVETNIRNLCYAMQLVSDQGFIGVPIDEKADKFNSMFETFIRTVDQWMSPLVRLREELDGLQRVSIAALHKSEEFRFRHLPREAFTSGEAYKRYLDSVAIKPGGQ